MADKKKQKLTSDFEEIMKQVNPNVIFVDVTDKVESIPSPSELIQPCKKCGKPAWEGYEYCQKCWGATVLLEPEPAPQPCCPEPSSNYNCSTCDYKERQVSRDHKPAPQPEPQPLEETVVRRRIEDMLVLILKAGRWCRDDVDAIMQAITEQSKADKAGAIKQFADKCIEGMPKLDYDDWIIGEKQDLGAEKRLLLVEGANEQFNACIDYIRAMAEKEGKPQ